MNLTVSARIAGGAIFTIALLGILVFSGLSGISSINDGLVRVTDESTPMLEETSHVMTSLLKATVAVNNFHQEMELDKLQTNKDIFSEQQKQNTKSSKYLAQLSAGHSAIDSSFSKSKKVIKEYFGLVPQSFQLHQQDLTLQAQLEEKQVEFEDAADELDSLLSDFSDEAKSKQVSDNASALSSMVTEATVTITDSLAIAELPQVLTAQNEIDTLMSDFNRRFGVISKDRSAQRNEYFYDTLVAIDIFKNIVIGNSSILFLLEEQLKTKQQAKQELVKSAQVADQALVALEVVAKGVSSFNASIKQEASENVASSRTLMIGLAIMAILVAVGINTVVLKSIRGPLAEVLRAMTQVASGDLKTQVEVRSDDEIGKLSAGINKCNK